MQTRARLGPVVLTALVAALAGVAALVWFALAPSQVDAAGGARERSGAEAESSAAAESARAYEPVAAAADSPTALDAARREEETPVIPAGYVLVVVRRAEDREPIAGATVFWAEASTLRWERDRRGSDESYVDPNELVEAVGARATTDARGRCLLGPMAVTNRVSSDGGLTISARHDTLWALVETSITTDRRLVTIDLSDADVVRVQVVGADGTPLPGVVAVFGSAGQDMRQSRRALTEGRDAIATIRGVTAFTRFFSDPDAMQWGVSVALPLRTCAFTAVDLGALPKEPVVVRVPACGRMVITLRGRDGQVIRRKARVTVTGYQRLESTTGKSSAPSGPSVSTQLLVAEDGWVELPFVDVGMALDVSAEVDRAVAGHAFLEGPKAVGERKEASLDLDYGTVKFVGMLVRADDTPAAGERFELRVVGNRNSMVRRSGVLPYEEAEVGEGTTDAQGKYSILVPVVGTLLAATGAAATTKAAIPVAAETNCKKVITANCVRYVNPDSPE
jgi:hypothetical protein